MAPRAAVGSEKQRDVLTRDDAEHGALAGDAELGRIAVVVDRSLQGRRRDDQRLGDRSSDGSRRDRREREREGIGLAGGVRGSGFPDRLRKQELPGRRGRKTALVLEGLRRQVHVDVIGGPVPHERGRDEATWKYGPRVRVKNFQASGAAAREQRLHGRCAQTAGGAGAAVVDGGDRDRNAPAGVAPGVAASREDAAARTSTGASAGVSEGRSGVVAVRRSAGVISAETVRVIRSARDRDADRHTRDGPARNKETHGPSVSFKLGWRDHL